MCIKTMEKRQLLANSQAIQMTELISMFDLTSTGTWHAAVLNVSVTSLKEGSE